jgi:hypothetical protein
MIRRRGSGRIAGPTGSVTRGSGSKASNMGKARLSILRESHVEEYGKTASVSPGWKAMLFLVVRIRTPLQCREEE